MDECTQFTAIIADHYKSKNEIKLSQPKTVTDHSGSDAWPRGHKDTAQPYAIYIEREAHATAVEDSVSVSVPSHGGARLI